MSKLSNGQRMRGDDDPMWNFGPLPERFDDWAGKAADAVQARDPHLIVGAAEADSLSSREAVQIIPSNISISTPLTCMPILRGDVGQQLHRILFALKRRSCRLCSPLGAQHVDRDSAVLCWRKRLRT